MKDPQDMTLEELEQYDDGDYYNNERGDPLGFFEFAAVILVSGGLTLLAFFEESWWIFGIAMTISCVAGCAGGQRQQNNKRERLRAVAQEHYEYEAARKAEEEMV